MTNSMKTISDNSALKKYAAMGTFALVAFAAAPLASGAVVIADSFDGPANTALNGTDVETWNSSVYESAPTWTTYNGGSFTNVVYSSTGTSVTAGASGASAQFQVATPSQSEGLLTLSADVKVQSADWIAFTLMGSSQVFYNSSSTLLVLLNATGYVQVYKNGTTTNLYQTGSPISGWSNSAVHSFEIQYDRTAKTLDVFVDGNKINNNSINVGDPNNASYDYVGMRMQGAGIQAGVPTIDNFSYSASAIPEPAAGSLMIGAAAALLAGLAYLRRRR